MIHVLRAHLRMRDGENDEQLLPCNMYSTAKFSGRSVLT